MATRPVSDGELQGYRQKVLDEEIAGYVRSGYYVVSRGESSAQLIRKKKFSLFWGVLLLLLGIVPGIAYLFWYLAKKDRYVYLSVDPSGKVESTRGKR